MIILDYADAVKGGFLNNMTKNTNIAKIKPKYNEFINIISQSKNLGISQSEINDNILEYWARNKTVLAPTLMQADNFRHSRELDIGALDINNFNFEPITCGAMDILLRKIWRTKKLDTFMLTSFRELENLTGVTQTLSPSRILNRNGEFLMSYLESGLTAYINTSVSRSLTEEGFKFLYANVQTPSDYTVNLFKSKKSEGQEILDNWGEDNFQPPDSTYYDIHKEHFIAILELTFARVVIEQIFYLLSMTVDGDILSYIIKNNNTFHENIVLHCCYRKDETSYIFAAEGKEAKNLNLPYGRGLFEQENDEHRKIVFNKNMKITRGLKNFKPLLFSLVRNTIEKDYINFIFKCRSHNFVELDDEFFDNLLQKVLDTAIDVIQTYISSIIERAKSYKSTVVLSVNPIDFLTMSVNENNSWRSCYHSIDGEYSGAVHQLLQDSSSIVAFGTTNDGVESPETNLLSGYNNLPPFEWTAKKWRVLVHVAKNKMSCLMPPVYKNEAFEIKTEVIKSLFENEILVGNIEDYIIADFATQQYYEGGEVFNPAKATDAFKYIDTYDFIQKYARSYYDDSFLGYQDLSNKETKTFVVHKDKLKELMLTESKTIIRIGENVSHQCTFCSNEIDNNSLSREIPVCSYHAQTRAGIRCNACGVTHEPENMIEDSHGDMYCYNCIDECYHCGTLLLYDEDRIYDYNGNSYCESCYENIVDIEED